MKLADNMPSCQPFNFVPQIKREDYRNTPGPGDKQEDAQESFSTVQSA